MSFRRLACHGLVRLAVASALLGGCGLAPGSSHGSASGTPTATPSSHPAPTATVPSGTPTPVTPPPTAAPSGPVPSRWLRYENRFPPFSVSFPDHWVAVTPDVANEPVALRLLADHHPNMRDRIPSLAEEIRDDETRILLGLEDLPSREPAADVVVVVAGGILEDSGGFDAYLQELVRDLDLMNEPYLLQRLPHASGQMARIRTESEEGVTDSYLIAFGDDVYSLAFSRRGDGSPDWTAIASSFQALPGRTRGPDA